MNNPLEFYKSRKRELEKEALNLKKKLTNLGVFRLSIFVTTCFLSYLTFGKYPDDFIIAFLGIAFFSFLVFKYIKLKKEKAIVDAKIKMKKMAEAIRVGESVIISGILDESKDGKLFLNPAIQRDPKASFKP